MTKTKLESKKEMAKLAIASSFGAFSASTLISHNDRDNQTIKTIQYGSGAALVGFSLWHLFLNNQSIEADEKEEINQHSETQSIQLKSFYTEIALSGKLTQKELKTFETKIENLLQKYYLPQNNAPTLNILADIRGIEGIEIKAIWNEFLFAMRHYKQFKKIAVVGNKKFEKASINVLNKITSIEMMYTEHYDNAREWLLS